MNTDLQIDLKSARIRVNPRRRIELRALRNALLGSDQARAENGL